MTSVQNQDNDMVFVYSFFYLDNTSALIDFAASPYYYDKDKIKRLK